MRFSRLTLATVALASAGLVAPMTASPAVSAEGAAAYRVSLKISTTFAEAKADRVKLTGAVTPLPPADSTVVLQAKYENKNLWRKVATATVKPDGTYRFVEKPETHLDRVYRVVKRTDGDVLGAKSRERSLQVIAWSWLTQLLPSSQSGMLTAPTLPINGDDYANTLYAERTQTTAFVEYTLGRDCFALESTFGLSDRTETGGKAAIHMARDGEVIYGRIFDLGQSEAVELDVTDVYRVRLDFAQVAETPDTEPAAGSARVLCD